MYSVDIFSNAEMYKTLDLTYELMTHKDKQL